MANSRRTVSDLAKQDAALSKNAAVGSYYIQARKEPASTGEVVTHDDWVQSQRMREMRDHIEYVQTLVCRWRVDAWLNGRVRSFAPKLPMTRAEIEALVLNLFGPVSFVAVPVPFTLGEPRCLSEEVG